MKKLSANPCYFVTGTDTDVGKTVASLALIDALQKRSKIVHAYKPVAAGAQRRNCFGEHRLNDDAYLLQQSASVMLDYDLVNPVLLDQAIAPHIAANQEHREVSVESCISHLLGSVQRTAKAGDIVLVEGAGGWRVPLNGSQYFSDIAIALEAKIILVVAIKLGCLNHAQLTFEAIKADGLQLAGWVANHTSPFDNADAAVVARENISTLEKNISAPLLAEIPFTESLDAIFESDESRVSVIKQVASHVHLERMQGI